MRQPLQRSSMNTAEQIVAQSTVIKSPEHYAMAWLATFSDVDLRYLLANPNDIGDDELVDAVYHDYALDTGYMVLRNLPGYDPVDDPWSNWSRTHDALALVLT